MRKRTFSVSLLSAMIVAAGARAPAEAPADSWPAYHGGPDQRGAAAVAVPDAPVLRWKVLCGAAVEAAPVSDGERVFAVTRRGEVRAVGLRDGAVLWTGRIEPRPAAAEGNSGPVAEAPPVVVDGRLVVAARDGRVTAFDAASGERRWERDLATAIQGSPTWVPRADGEALVIVVSQADGAVTALRLGSGETAWTAAGSGRCDGSPAAAEGRVVYGSCAAALHVLDAGSGKTARRIDLGEGNEVAAGVALAGGRVFAGARSGRVVCADPGSGVILWTNADSRAEVFTTPAESGGTIVFAADDGRVAAVGSADGRGKWVFSAGGCKPQSAVIAGDRVVVACGGSLYVLALEDGSKRWEAAIADELSPPALVRGWIVVGGDDGVLRAYGPPAP